MSADRFWIVGCGAMAGAMLSRWLATGMDPESVTVVDPALPTVGAAVRVVAALPNEPPPDLLMLGIKPQLLVEVTMMIAPIVGADTMLLSILAGKTHATLKHLFPNAQAVVRVMPNLPVAIGEGAVAMFAPDADRVPLTALMAPLGLVEWIDDECLFDAVTALSGSGPAFLYRFAEALAKGGVAMGLSPNQADRLARATVAGAAALAASAPERLMALADRVASKGGSTRAGLDVFDDDAALSDLVERALHAAQARNRALAAI